MADKIYLLRGNDTPMAVCLRYSEGGLEPVPYDLSEAERVRLALVGHGMHIFAKDTEVSGTDHNIVSGVIPGRSLLPGDYDLEVTFTLDGRDKRFAVDDMFEAVDFLSEDADGETEGEGAGIWVNVTVQPEVIEIAGPTGPKGDTPVLTADEDGTIYADGVLLTEVVKDVTEAVESAEQSRAAAESQRVAAESARVSAETARESQSASDHTLAESDHTRAESDHTNSVTATNAANSAAEHAEEAAETIDEKIAGKANTDGYYGGMTVGTAENLVGRGSVEAEFQGIRTSAGSEDIGNGSATIREVKGRSIVWNQLIKNGDFSNGTTDWEVRYIPHATLSIDRGMLKITRTGSYYSFGQKLGTPHVEGHKYLVSFYFEKDEGMSIPTIWVNFVNAFSDGPGNSPLAIDYSKDGYYSRIYNFPTARSKYLVINPGNAIDTSVYIDNFQLIDLTQMFGAGNEPATVEEFKAMFPLPYYEYNAGTLVNNEATGIRTRGFNLYNHATGKAVLPGKYSDYPYEYEICGAFTSISFEDYAGNVSTPELHDGRFFNVPSPGVLTVTGGNDTDTLVHLVWSGWRNFGEPDYAYEKYWENTLRLNIKSITGKLNGEGDSVTIFPEGMRSAGTAYDYLIVDADGYARKAVKVMESVDMGEIGWRYLSDRPTFDSPNNAIPNISTFRTNGSPHIVCQKYVADTNQSLPAVGSTLSADKSIVGWASTNRVIIRDDSYTDAATFKSAVSGVELVYELATPLVYVLDTPIPMTYPVDDFSIEAKLPVDTAELPTGPIRYAVTYPMNAVDPLRRLPTNYMSKESMQNFLTALKTAGIIADFTMTYNSTAGAYTFTITAPSTEPANTNESEL